MAVVLIYLFCRAGLFFKKRVGYISVLNPRQLGCADGWLAVLIDGPAGRQAYLALAETAAGSREEK